jgi:dynein heavy chain
MKEILESWVKVQSGWIYLESIFVSEDICNQMSSESELFNEVDQYWREIMSSSVSDPRALVVISKPNMLEKLKKSEAMLDKIYKGLYAYLEKKRLFFPRFFFLSNDELIEILSETRDPNRVQPHLKKCFEGISRLCLDTTIEPNIINGMLSSESETVQFLDEIIPSDANGLVEIWLQQVEKQMRKSLNFEIQKCMNDFKLVEKFLDLIYDKKYASQVLLVCNYLYWTAEVTEVIHFHLS